jgi:hypothetical protein
LAELVRRGENPTDWELARIKSWILAAVLAVPTWLVAAGKSTGVRTAIEVSNILTQALQPAFYCAS